MQREGRSPLLHTRHKSRKTLSVARLGDALQGSCGHLLSTWCPTLRPLWPNIWPCRGVHGGNQRRLYCTGFSPRPDHVLTYGGHGRLGRLRLCTTCRYDIDSSCRMLITYDDRMKSITRQICRRRSKLHILASNTRTNHTSGLDTQT
jgi:hypothetical protein